jgi:drug/metabolite transporter (DMT)-like permease
MGIGLSFLLTAVSGVVLLFVEGGRHGFADPLLIFSRTTWDLIHTWAGIALILVAALHFAIHWGWIVKVSSKMIGALLPASSRNPAVEPVKVNQS